MALSELINCSTPVTKSVNCSSWDSINLDSKKMFTVASIIILSPGLNACIYPESAHSDVSILLSEVPSA